MSTFTSGGIGRGTLKKKGPMAFGALLFVGLTGTQCATDDNSNSATTAEETTTTTTEETTSEPTSTEVESVQEAAPEEWAQEYLEVTCAPGESIANQGNILCGVEDIEVDADGDTLMINYSGDPAVSDYFANEPSAAGLVTSTWGMQASNAKAQGDPRMADITEVLVTGPGGPTGTWEDSAELW